MLDIGTVLLILAAAWSLIACCNVAIQYTNTRAARDNWRFLKTAPPTVRLATRSALRYNLARSFAVLLNTAIGFIGLVTLAYHRDFIDAHQTPGQLPWPFLINLVAIGADAVFLSNELVFLVINIMEFIDRRHLRRLVGIEVAPDPAAVSAAVVRDPEQLRHLAGSLVGGVVVIDRSGTVLEWFNGMEELSGFPAAAARGRDLTETIIPARYQPAHNQALSRYRQLGASRRVGQFLALELRRADGSELPVYLLLIEAGVLVVGILWRRQAAGAPG